MANNDRNISLRIRAQTEGLSELQRAAKALEILGESQREFGQSAGLAGRSLGQLETELKELNRTAKSLDGIEANQKAFRDQVKSLRQNRDALAKARESLAGYEKSLEGVKRKNKEQTQTLKDYRGEVKRLEGEQRKLRDAAIKTRDALRVSGAIGGTKQVQQLREQNNAQRAAALQNINEFDARLAREKQITEELEKQRKVVEKRRAAERQVRSGFRAFSQNANTVNERNRLQRNLTARGIVTEEKKALEERTRNERKAAEESQRLERQKTATLKREINKRIEAERKVTSGFAAFSRGAGGAPARARQAELGAASRQSALGASQVRERDAALRQLEIERRYQEVLARRPALQRAAAQATRQSADATRRLSGAQRQAGADLSKFLDGTRQSLSLYQRVRGEVLSLAAAYVGIFGVAGFAQGAVQAQNDRIALQTRLLVANGNSAVGAARDFNFLRSEADRLGFSLNNLGGVYSRLRIAASAAGFSTQEAQEVFTNFSEVARVFNLSADDTAGVFRALEQILSKGTIQAEEIRGQLGDRLPAAFATLAKSLNVTEAELNKLLESGSVSSRRLLEFSREYKQLVGDQVPAATKTLSSELQRLGTAYDDFRILVAESGLNEAIRDLAVGFRAFLASEDGKQAARDLGQAFLALSKTLQVLLFDTDGINFALDVLRGLLIALAAQFSLNFINGVIALRTALVGYSVAAGGAATATGALTVAFRGLGAAALTLLKNPLFLIGAAIATPFILLANEVQKTAEAMKAGAEATEEVRKAIVELELARGTDEEKEAQDRINSLVKERVERLSQAEALLAQAEAQVELNAALDAGVPLGEPGERAFRASRDLNLTRRIEERKAEVRQLRSDLEAIYADAEKNAFAGAASKPADGRPSAAGVADPDETKRTLDRIAQLREQANREAIEQLKALLGELEQEEETALAARIALINIEADERIAALRAASEEARKLGALDVVRQNDLNIAGIDRERARRVAAAEADAAEDRAQRNADALKQTYEDQKTALDGLVAARDAELEAIETQRNLGRLTTREAQQEAERITREFQPRILSNLAALRDFIEANRGALSKMLNVDEVLLDLESLRIKTETVVTEGQRRAAQLREDFANGASQAFGALGQGIAGALRGFNSFGDAIRGVGEAFLNFAADFLVNIGQMIAEQTILNALQESAKNGNGGIFGTIGNLIANGVGGAADDAAGAAALSAAGATLTAAGGTLTASGATLSAAGGTLTAGGTTLATASTTLTTAATIWQAVAVQLQAAAAALAAANVAGSVAGVAHSGAIVGRGFPAYRRVNPAIFANAPRYHSGGIVGLKPDEVPAILQTGEEVLSRNDPRNAMNGGTGGGSNVQIVNAIDSESVVAAGLQGAAGRRVITNIIQANKAQFRQILAS